MEGGACGVGDETTEEAFQNSISVDVLADMPSQRHSGIEEVNPRCEPLPVSPLVPREALHGRDVRLADHQVLHEEHGQDANGRAID